jgi:hypothetical protein
MVLPIIGYPVGQWAVHDGVVAVLTHFNKRYEGRDLDGCIAFLFVNTTDEKRKVVLNVAVTYASDVFVDYLQFEERLAPRAVAERECAREELKDATYAVATFVVAGGSHRRFVLFGNSSRPEELHSVKERFERRRQFEAEGRLPR